MSWDDAMALLTPGSQAPPLDSLDQHGRPVRLSDARGRVLVVYFYPEDDTPGCTAEACGFRDLEREFSREGILVWGVSTQGVDSHRRFAEKHGLPFRLVADEGGEVTRAWGAMGENGYARRVTYVVAPDGRIDRAFERVTPDRHPAEVLDAAREVRTARVQG